MLRPNLFRRVTIVGVGLIGGSLGLAIKKHNIAREVVGVSQREATLTQALQSGAIDVALTDMSKAIRDSDLVVLAAPVETIVSLIPTITPFLKRGGIVTDVGSAKVEIIDAAESGLPPYVFFVSSHPLAGSEKKGIEFARADLFEGAQCIITPTERTNQAAKEKMKQFWMRLGSKVAELAPEEHDELLAYISHLPHLVAYALMGTLPLKSVEYPLQGLKDASRISASSPQLWADICMANSKNILKTLDEFVEHLSEFRRAIIQRDKNTLIQYFTKAQEKRNAIFPDA